MLVQIGKKLLRNNSFNDFRPEGEILRLVSSFSEHLGQGYISSEEVWQQQLWKIMEKNRTAVKSWRCLWVWEESHPKTRGDNDEDMGSINHKVGFAFRMIKKFNSDSVTGWKAEKSDSFLVSGLLVKRWQCSFLYFGSDCLNLFTETVIGHVWEILLWGDWLLGRPRSLMARLKSCLGDCAEFIIFVSVIRCFILVYDFGNRSSGGVEDLFINGEWVVQPSFLRPAFFPLCRFEFSRNSGTIAQAYQHALYE